MGKLDDVINVPQEKLWAHAMLFACNVTTKSTTTLAKGGKLPYKLWCGTAPIPDHLQSFGVVGYARRSLRKHKVAPKGEEGVFMGIPRNFPSDVATVLLVKTSTIVEREAMLWVDGSAKAGRDGIGIENLGTKPRWDE